MLVGELALENACVPASELLASLELRLALALAYASLLSLLCSTSVSWSHGARSSRPRWCCFSKLILVQDEISDRIQRDEEPICHFMVRHAQPMGPCGQDIGGDSLEVGWEPRLLMGEWWLSMEIHDAARALKKPFARVSRGPCLVSALM